MFFSIAEFLNLDKNGLMSFLDRCVPEGTQLDYKRTSGPLPLSGDTKAEFMKDVLAFANSQGGLLIYGFDEPNENTGMRGDFHGVEFGDEVASSLERVVQDTSDTRLPGFFIRSILIQEGLSAIACYITDSEMKPHSYKGRFFKRHSESSILMSAAEVKQTVLSSYSRRNEIDKAFERKESELLKYHLKSTPGFILQAIPLVALSEHWNVLSPAFTEVLRGNNRNILDQSYDLRCNRAPYVGIQSLQGDESREDSQWHIEVTTSGQISVIFRCPYTDDNGDKYLPYHTVNLFQSFGVFVDQMKTVANVLGSRTLIRCSYCNASDTYLLRRNAHRRYGPLQVDKVAFPELLVDFDASGQEIASRYCEMLYHLFEIRPNEEELPVLIDGV